MHEALYATWIKWYGHSLVIFLIAGDKECSPLLKSLATCHIGLGLPCGEQNLLLCETAQVSKSCLFLHPSVSHTALPEAGACLTVAQELTALACTPAYPWGNPLCRLLRLLLLHRRATTPQFLQAFLSGHHRLTHNGYRHQNQAVPPLLFVLCGSQRPFQCQKERAPSLCLVQSLLQELFPSQQEKAEMRQILAFEWWCCFFFLRPVVR